MQLLGTKNAPVHAGDRVDAELAEQILSFAKCMRKAPKSLVSANTVQRITEGVQRNSFQLTSKR